MKKFFSLLGMAILGGAITLGGYKMFIDENVVVQTMQQDSSSIIKTNYNPAFNANSSAINAASIDFTLAAENTVHSVVHVKNTAIRTQSNPWAE